MANTNSLLDSLRNTVGIANVLAGKDVTARASHFWNPTPLQALAIVRPKNSQELSSVMSACHAAKQTVVTHGGVTGLADGDHSTCEDLVVSMERMRQIETIDPINRTITVQAGCELEKVQTAAHDVGLQFGLDLGARGSCTIGGNISTNAGGLSVLRYGTMREQVIGLEVVLADGTIMSSMNSMIKNNTGYDLKQLFIGSEGTLGIVTRAVLRLRPATPSVQTALVAFSHFDKVTATLSKLSTELNGQLNAFEVIWQAYYQFNTDASIDGTTSAPLSGDYPFYAIIESRGSSLSADKLLFEHAMESALEQELIVDAVIPQSEKERAAIWAVRENVGIVLRHDPVFAYDISLPITHMQNYLNEVEEQLKAQWPSSAFYVFGHLADGNLHLMTVPDPGNIGATSRYRPRDDKDTVEKFSISNDIVYQTLARFGGSVSAEHGIGLLKKNYLSISRNKNEISLMHKLKDLLDPQQLLNPGKIL